MKRLIVLRFLIIASMLALLLVAVTPVFADTPGHATLPFDFIETWSGAENPCGFDIEVHTYGVLRANYWIDESGQQTREIAIFGALKHTVSAYGKSINIQTQGPIHLDFFSENHYIVISLGSQSIYTVPGYGKVFGGGGQIIEEITLDPDTGKIISDVILKQVGNIDLNSDFSPICEYLSP